MVPVLLSMTLLAAPLLVATGADAESLPAGAAQGARAITRPDTAAAAPARSDDGRVATTRSDGWSGFTRPPDAKDIRRLVGYMRNGMAHADKADREDRADDTRQTRKIPYRRDKRSRR